MSVKPFSPDYRRPSVWVRLALVFFFVPTLAFAVTVPTGGWIGSWAPGIGDPDAMGWITTLVYLLASAGAFFLFVQVGKPSRRDEGLVKKERIFWVLFGVLLLLLGINKQLDLQSAFTEVMRMMANSEGWYGDRRYYQVGFIAFLGLWLLAGIGGVFYLTYKLPAGVMVSALGLCFVVGYVIIRASSFHNVDEFIQSSILHLKFNWIIELGGLLVILAGEGFRWRELRRG